jgi:hypothetical protein
MMQILARPHDHPLVSSGSVEVHGVSDAALLNCIQWISLGYENRALDLSWLDPHQWLAPKMPGNFRLANRGVVNLVQDSSCP